MKKEEVGGGEKKGKEGMREGERGRREGRKERREGEREERNHVVYPRPLYW
jgi:hypothetical protein